MDNQNGEKITIEKTNKDNDTIENHGDNSEAPLNTNNVDKDIETKDKETYFDDHCQDCKRNYKVGSSNHINLLL